MSLLRLSDLNVRMKFHLTYQASADILILVERHEKRKTGELGNN